jgi:hypothetical protein
MKRWLNSSHLISYGIKKIAPDVTDDFLRTMWSRKLPVHIHIILAYQAKGKLDAASQLGEQDRGSTYASNRSIHRSNARIRLFPPED